MSEEFLQVQSFDPLEGIDESRRSDGSSTLTNTEIGDFSEAPFRSVSEALRSQRNREEGVWVRCPLFAGSEFRVGHIRACIPEKARLEQLYRQQRGIPLEQELDPSIDEQLLERAIFRTVLFEWKGVLFEDGVEFTSNFENFLQLIQIDEFKDWLSKVTSKAQTFRDRFDEEAEKN